jgi:hypothetical protein
VVVVVVVVVGIVVVVGASGVTEFELVDIPVPAAFTAATLNVYEVPFVRALTVSLVTLPTLIRDRREYVMT